MLRELRGACTGLCVLTAVRSTVIYVSQCPCLRTRLRAAPVTTKSLTSGAVSLAGDALAQALAARRALALGRAAAPFAWRRAAVFTALGCCYFGPLLHALYAWLAVFDRKLREDRGFSKVGAVCAQVAINQARARARDTHTRFPPPSRA